MPPGSVEHEKRWTKYWTGVKNLLDGRDVLAWEGVHASIRHSAARLDDNPELYLLLRLSSWERRKELTGRIGGALWIRHIAEVIRIRFEEFHQVRWLEEDRAFGRWSPGARARIFGAERTLDDTLAAKPYLAARFGLSTRSNVRWYLEGHTEYYAAAFVLNAQLAAQEPAKLGIELINLCGQIASGKKNAPLKLEQSLKEDLTMKRFSILSFDLDVIENQKFVRRQIENNTIVGLINANKPDFEFANFSIEELIEVAALMDDRAGFDGGRLRGDAKWNGVTSGRMFEQQYRGLSGMDRDLKGKAWGEALAEYAVAHPRIEGTDRDRPLIDALAAAVRAWSSSYDTQRDRCTFDPITFELIDR